MKNLFEYIRQCCAMSPDRSIKQEDDQNLEKVFVNFLTLIEGMIYGRLDDLHFIYMLLKILEINVPEFPKKLSEESYEALYFEALSFLYLFTSSESCNSGNNCLIKIDFVKFGCSLFTDISLLVVSKMCPKLRILNVDYWTQITDKGLFYITQRCPELEILGLNMCNNITDAGVMEIAKMCPKLKEINLSGCKNITDKSVNALKKWCPNIEYINVQDTKVTEKVYLLFKLTFLQRLFRFLRISSPKNTKVLLKMSM